MSALEFQLISMFSVEHCCNCGMQFAMLRNYQDRRLEDGKQFFCPAGHPQHYTETEIVKLKKQVEQERKLKEWAQEDAKRARDSRGHAERRVIAMKGIITKTKKRVGHGVCPCCNRTFKQLAAHMKAKHPTYHEEPI